MERIINYFKLRERNTSIRTEFIAGLTTFIAMVYIVIVNPSFWSSAGMSFSDSYTATIISICVGTLIMGLIANYPIAIAPGIGINVYLVFNIAMNNSWQEAIGISVVAAAVFTAISLTSFRRHFIESIPESQKVAIGVGIGFFVSFIGMQNGHLIIDSPSTLVTLGSLHDSITLLTIFGLLMTIILMVRGVNGAVFIGMIITSILAYVLGMLTAPTEIISMPASPIAILGQFSFNNLLSHAFEIFAILLLTLFDTTGTFLGIGRQAGIIKKGFVPNFESALLADSIGSLVGGLFSGGPTSSFVESGAGVAAGGRTGLTVVFTTIFFVAMFFLSPIAQMIASVPSITAPALIIIGIFMADGLREINWGEMSESIPAFFTMIMMPLTYSITIGIGVGFLLYSLTKIVTGNANKVHPLMYLFSVLFALQIAFFS